MKFKHVLLVLALAVGITRAADKAAGKPADKTEPRPAGRAGQVLDLGQLEVEGEIRRPNMNWVDSQKRVKDMLPSLHRDEFQKLEEELLKPMRPQDVKTPNPAQEETHARN